MAYLAQLRAEHAAALFLSTDEPVTTIGRGQLQGVVERLDGVCFERFGNPDGPRALAQVWKAQHFSYWMTTILHMLPGASDFDLRRQFGGTRVGDGLGSRVDFISLRPIPAGPAANQTTLAKAPGCPRFNGWPSLYYGDEHRPNPRISVASR